MIRTVLTMLTLLLMGACSDRESTTLDGAVDTATVDTAPDSHVDKCPKDKPVAGHACQVPKTQDCVYTETVECHDLGPYCEPYIKTHCTCQSNLWSCMTEIDAGP